MPTQKQEANPQANKPKKEIYITPYKRNTLS